MIVCLIDFGVLNYTIMLPDGKNINIATKEFVPSIVKYAQTYNCDLIKLVGNYDYVKHYAQLIKEEEIKEYQTKKLNIEIIGGNKNE